LADGDGEAADADRVLLGVTGVNEVGIMTRRVCSSRSAPSHSDRAVFITGEITDVNGGSWMD
jgi:hypothetical protein